MSVAPRGLMGGAIDAARSVGLDQLRGIAIGLVLLRHAFPSAFPGAGVVGVVMFFAISGYLITGVLMRDLADTGRVRFGRFYSRRAWRLVPALLAVVVTIGVVTLLIDPLDDRDELVRTIVVALTWTADLPFEHGSEATFHLWTLAVEEQFYLAWPALLLLAVRVRRVGLLLVASGLTCLLACVATLVWLAEDPDLAYTLPTSWAVCFVIGSAARWTGPRLPAPTAAVAALALLPLAGLAVVPLRGHAAMYLLAAPAIALLTVVLARGWHDQPVRFRPGPALAALGTVSYAAYLWNYPLTLWLRPLGWYGGLLALAATLVIAALSWRWLEAPLLAAREARAQARREVPAGAAR